MTIDPSALVAQPTAGTPDARADAEALPGDSEAFVMLLGACMCVAPLPAPEMLPGVEQAEAGDVTDVQQVDPATNAPASDEPMTLRPGPEMAARDQAPNISVAPEVGGEGPTPRVPMVRTSLGEVPSAQATLSPFLSPAVPEQRLAAPPEQLASPALLRESSGDQAASTAAP
ncbi:MAG: hypothetical protein GF393_12565, partial [Armatimonadia bacterium]|nr:hypothetical protein [Armatimonadia bacterium]